MLHPEAHWPLWRPRQTVLSHRPALKVNFYWRPQRAANVANGCCSAYSAESNSPIKRCTFCTRAATAKATHGNVTFVANNATMSTNSIRICWAKAINRIGSVRSYRRRANLFEFTVQTATIESSQYGYAERAHALIMGEGLRANTYIFYIKFNLKNLGEISERSGFLRQCSPL